MFFSASEGHGTKIIFNSKTVGLPWSKTQQQFTEVYWMVTIGHCRSRLPACAPRPVEVNFQQGHLVKVRKLDLDEAGASPGCIWHSKKSWDDDDDDDDDDDVFGCILMYLDDFFNEF